MEIESIRHKALRHFVETGQTKGLPANVVERLRNMLAYIVAIETEDELIIPPNFGAHRLKGNREGTWALTVTRNWRLTFTVNATLMIVDMDLEDYR